MNNKIRSLSKANELPTFSLDGAIEQLQIELKGADLSIVLLLFYRYLNSVRFMSSLITSNFSET